MSFKCAFIGAGSVGFTRKLLSDILTVPEFHDIEIAFMDINEHNLDMVTALCQRDIDGNGLSIKIKKTLDRREALQGAKYVLNVVRIGVLEGFETDIEIPLKYGLDQCVGDTLAAGGIMYGQRGVAYMLDLCRDIREVCAPDPLILNYANPNAMMTWAAIKYGGVRTLGLCHGVQGGHHLIADALGVKKEELDIVCAGLNHQTWYIQAKYKGKDMLPGLLEAIEKDPRHQDKEKCRIDVMRNFGYFSTESNGHLSEYLMWYRKRHDAIGDYISMTDYDWINGETGGYLRACREGRNWFETDFPAWLEEPPMQFEPSSRSEEHGSYILEGLETGRAYRGHFNTMNNGCITNLPDECIVEVPCFADGNGISVPKVGDLPLGCAAICSQSAWVQRLAVEAAVAGDIVLLRQAMMMDPLTGSTLTPPEIIQMTDEMLVGGEQWLPQYAGEIARAKKRLADDYVTPKYAGYESPYRRRVRDPEEIRAERSSKVSAEDKAFKLDKKG